MKNERDNDEEMLLAHVESFIKFMTNEPKVRFNLHDALREICQKMEYIKENLK